MSNFKNLLLLMGLTLLFSCKNGEKPTAGNGDTQMVGNDSGDHGCKASAGYTWSSLKGECIRLFESGIRLSDKTNQGDSTLTAFVIFQKDTTDTKAEVFLPGRDKSIIFDKFDNGNYLEWKNDTLQLKARKGIFMISGSHHNVLYHGFMNH